MARRRATFGTSSADVESPSGSRRSLTQALVLGAGAQITFYALRGPSVTLSRVGQGTSQWVRAAYDGREANVGSFMNVADLSLGSTDPMGDQVVEFSGYNPPFYAVYRTQRRMKIMFADDAAENARQRASLAPLNPIRGEIVGLIDGWQTSARKLELAKGKPADQASQDEPDKPWYSPARWVLSWRKHRAKRAERLNRRVGDALIWALEGDVTGSTDVLAKIKQDIIDERTAWARFQYLIAAFSQALLAGLVLYGVHVQQANTRAATVLSSEGWEVLSAGGAGALGAFFSISLAIRGRTVLPDLQWVSNIMDATLRVIIGVLAAGILEALVLAQVVHVVLGNNDLSSAAGGWINIFLVGVVGGFSERLVPDLLARADVQARSAPTTPSPVTKLPLAESPAEASSAPPQPVAADRATDQLDDDQDDHACEDDMVGASATADADLPPASGGVAAKAA